MTSIRIIHCKYCGTVVECKKRGRPKICCDRCILQKKYDRYIKYIKNNRKKILLRAKNYREANRERLRMEGRLYSLRETRAREEYNESLLDDVIAHPRKYLKRVDK